MTKLPIIDASEFEKILIRLGFRSVRQKGSHVFYKHQDGRTTTLPHHKGRVISRPLIRKVLNDIEINPDEYLELLKK